MEQVQEDAAEILRGLSAVLPPYIDGRDAIVEMRDRGSRNWRQMEWIGFWFEDVAAPVLVEKLGGALGPTYYNTEFDYQRNRVWDLKAHPTNSPNGTANGEIICNDTRAVDMCISECGGLGFIIVNGVATYDRSGEFKAWHDVLKGGQSKYELNRVARGATSRARKSAFEPSKVEAVFFQSLNDLEDGIRDGWAKLFQDGMRNSDGSPRLAKYQLSTSRIPQRYRVDSVRLG